MSEPVYVVDAQAAELEQVLAEIAGQYQELARCAVERREAMRRADTRRLAHCVGSENAAVQRIADLERRRMAVVETLAARVGAPGKSQTPVSQLAPLLPEPARSRLLMLAQGLRDLMEKVAVLNEATRKAAEALSAHMEGLMRHVAAKLNHAQTYGPSGVIGAGGRVMSALDSVA